MDDILQEIVANKRLEVARQKEAIPLQNLLSMAYERMQRPVCSLRKALEESPSGIIAEFKRKSPSKGCLFADARIEAVVPAYAQAVAAACSILTDSHFFGGSFGDLAAARRLVNIPLLRKDFIIDEYQLYQARALGADAVLLIAAALTEDVCRSLAATAHQLGLEVLLEVHGAEELSYLNPHIDLLGVNNRHLGSFHTDVDVSFRLMERLRAAGNFPLPVSESGIASAEVAARLREVGYRGLLIGETFMKTGQPGEALTHFIGGMS